MRGRDGRCDDGSGAEVWWWNRNGVNGGKNYDGDAE